LHVITVCGMGFGTSLMLLMNIQEIGRKYGFEITGEAVDLGSYKGKPCDFIAASSEIVRQIISDKPVVAIDNLLNKKEVENKISPYLKK